jgi:hypothetical protein
MAETRNKLKENNDNTWGSYVFFGNPAQVYWADEISDEAGSIRQSGFVYKNKIAIILTLASIIILLSVFIVNGVFDKKKNSNEQLNENSQVSQITNQHPPITSTLAVPTMPIINKDLAGNENLQTYKPNVPVTPVGNKKDAIPSENMHVPISHQPKSDSKASNIFFNTGIAINEFCSNQIEVQDEWVFYINEDDNDCIYKTSTGGKNAIKMTDESCISFVVLGEWIYYSSDSGIYKTPANGSKVKVLVNRDRFNTSAAYYDKIYYPNNADDDNIYVLKSDGISSIKFADLCPRDMIVNNNWLYYTDTHDSNKLYKIDIDSKETKLLNDFNTTCFKVDGEYIYYVDEQGIHRKHCDGTNQINISNDIPTAIDVYGNWIYYNYGHKGGGLYKIKTDGSQKNVIHKNRTGQIKAIEGAVFYINIDKGFKIYSIY